MEIRLFPYVHKDGYIRLPFLFLLIFISSEIPAQVSPVYTKHYNYEAFVNPAITGRDKYPLVCISHKRNWLGTKHTPNTTCAGGSFRIGEFDFYTPTKMLNKSGFFSRDRMGMGGFLMLEQNGPLMQFYSSVNYAYFVPLNANHTTELSFGLSAQLQHASVNEDMLDPNDPGDPELADLNNLPYIADGGFGVYFHTGQFHAGASVNELFHNASPLDDERYFSNSMDFSFQTGYKFYLKYFDFEPSVFIAKIDKDPLYHYAQVKFFYRNYNWLALAYKSTRSVTISIGLRVRRWHLAYGYEQSISRLSNYFSGSHEIMLGLNIGLFEPEGLRKTVRRKR
ncbi:MAG: PorP/SprF family type IX secretion system membrane protein [Bacteroidales bacterium]|nr:PorP/SprF family type IX secretion system membrane protein [Bacteroidales bacterium]